MARQVRAGLAGLFLFGACIWIGHSAANPSIVSLSAGSSTVHASRDPFFGPYPTIPPPTTTTIPPKPRLSPVKASRGERRSDLAVGPNRAFSTPEERQTAITEICSYTWPCEDAVRVASCESGLRWWARNRYSSASGIFQILHGPLDLVANIRLAFGMWSRSGWDPWRSSRACSHV